MSDKSFTFFEFHFHDAFQFGPGEIGRLGGSTNELAADEEDADTAADEQSSPAEPDDEGRGGCLVCKLVGLGVLAAAAYAVRKLLGGPSGLDALDDIEELDEFGGESADTGEPEDDGSVDIEVTSGEEPSSGGKTGLLVAVAVTLLVLLAVAAKKLLGADVEEIEIPDGLAEE